MWEAMQKKLNDLQNQVDFEQKAYERTIRDMMHGGLVAGDSVRIMSSVGCQ
jgi:hypothetical protein